MRTILTLIALAAMTGCSDPKAATEKNFKVAMQSYLDTAYPRCYVSQSFPYVDDSFDIMGTRTRLKALAKIGLVVSTEEQRQVPNLFGTPRTQKVTVYDLTGEGKKYFKANVEKNKDGSTGGGFCFGKAKVKEITQFSEPADMFGQKISRVNYEYTVTDLPSWASNAEITSVLPALHADGESKSKPIKRLDAVILTNNGWVHESLFKK